MVLPGGLVISARPRLRQPCLLCGISGWVDGGEAATGTVEYLIEKLGARDLAEIPIDRFHIFQVPGQVSMRPYIRIEDGLIKDHEVPENRFFYWRNRRAARDLILFKGSEPNMNWPEFIDAILHIVRSFSVSVIYLLGGVLDRVPHTREPNVSCSCSLPALKREMRAYGVSFGSYEGPGRFGSSLLYRCSQDGIPMVSLTARATYYPEHNIFIQRNPKVIRALLRRLNTMLQLQQDLSDLDGEVRRFEGRLNRMVARDQEFVDYLARLEADYVELPYHEPLELSGDEAVRIAEELLRADREE